MSTSPMEIERPEQLSRDEALNSILLKHSDPLTAVVGVVPEGGTVPPPDVRKVVETWQEYWGHNPEGICDQPEVRRFIEMLGKWGGVIVASDNHDGEADLLSAVRFPQSAKDAFSLGEDVFAIGPFVDAWEVEEGAVVLQFSFPYGNHFPVDIEKSHIYPDSLKQRTLFGELIDFKEENDAKRGDAYVTIIETYENNLPRAGADTLATSDFLEFVSGNQGRLYLTEEKTGDTRKLFMEADVPLPEDPKSAFSLAEELVDRSDHLKWLVREDRGVVHLIYIRGDV